MKIMLFLIATFTSLQLNAQTPGEQLATKIAKRLKDSLVLTEAQQTQLYKINMELHNQKQVAFQRYTVPDSLRIHVQKIENTRDTLYSTVLSPTKYLLYKQRKRELLYNN